MDEAHLEAIASAPDDPGPRLVYADVLTARQDPHGELIIVQHDLARLRLRLGDNGERARGNEVERLRFRERELVLAVCKRIGLPPRSLTFAQGFVHSITLTPFLPDVLVRAFAHPAMRFVRAVTVGQHDAALAQALIAAPFASKIRSLAGRVRDVLGPLIVATGGKLEELSIPIDALPSVQSSKLPLVTLTIGGDATTVEAPVLAAVLRGDVFPTLRHLRLDTWRGVDANVIEALASSSRSRVTPLASLAVNFAGATPAFVRFRGAFEGVELLPLERLASTNASGLCALGEILLELGRPEAAIVVFESAHTMQCGQFDAARVGLERALTAAGSSRTVDDGDPKRDRDPARLAGLMKWSAEARDVGRSALADRLLDRVLAASPDHAGAWVSRAAATLSGPDRSRDHGQGKARDLERSAGIRALVRAIAGDGDHLGTPGTPPDDRDVSAIATAYALLPDDPHHALETLSDVLPDAARRLPERLHQHAAVLATFARLTLDQADDALATLDALEARAGCPSTFAISWLARGIVERARGRRDAAMTAWKRCLPPCFSPGEITDEIADAAQQLRREHDDSVEVHSGEEEPTDQMLCSAVSIFAAQLTEANDSAQARRDELKEWLEDVGPLRPQSGLVFVPMIARVSRAFPKVFLDDLEGVLDRLAGLSGWRFRPKSAEFWRRR